MSGDQTPAGRYPLGLSHRKGITWLSWLERAGGPLVGGRDIREAGRRGSGISLAAKPRPVGNAGRGTRVQSAT